MALFAKHPDWQMAFQDEVWWSRLAQPHLHAWTTDQPLARVEKQAVKTETEPKALCCYGAFLTSTGQEQAQKQAQKQVQKQAQKQAQKQGQMLLRFVEGRPVSQVTCDFLSWLAETQAQAGKKVLCLIWANASWHISKRVKSWLKTHNRRVKANGGCRVLVCVLPSKSSWLNAIEPKWVHGKRAIGEAVRTLKASELTERICAYYQCGHEPHLTQEHC